MADNVTTPIPNGTVLAGDEINGTLYPRSKMVMGDDGTAVDIGPSNPLPTKLTADQDPVLDHANGVKYNVTTASTTAITPPANCKYIRVHAEADCFIRTDGNAAADAAGSIKLLANQPETIPVIAGTAVTVIAASATTLRATPMKVR